MSPEPVAVVDAARAGIAWLLGVCQVPILGYFLAINTSYLVLLVSASLDFAEHLRRSSWSDRDAAAASPLVPGVSLVVPAYNEQRGIVASVESLLSLHHPRHEVVVVDDGSTDDTFGVLADRFDLVGVDRDLPADVPVGAAVVGVYVPQDGRTRLLVVRKENSGKTDAVNTGINAAQHQLVAIVDADSVLDPDALVAVTEPFVVDPLRTVATGGVIRAANGCTVVDGRVVAVGTPRSWLARIQVIEYLRAFLMGRSGWSRLGGLILVSGAFGVFRRDVLVDIGGLDAGSIGEDFELVMRMHRLFQERRQDYRVCFVSEPVCWTEVPESTAVLRKQRRRWHRGLWEVLWKYRRMLFNPRYGRIGLVVLPWFWLFELLAPALELAGLVLLVAGLLLGVVEHVYAGLFLACAYGYAAVINVSALTIEELTFHRYPRWRDLGICLVASIVENVGYRQLTACWRCAGAWQGIRGKKAVWGTMTRTGFATASRTTAPTPVEVAAAQGRSAAVAAGRVAAVSAAPSGAVPTQAAGPITGAAGATAPERGTGS